MHSNRFHIATEEERNTTGVDCLRAIDIDEITMCI